MARVAAGAVGAAVEISVEVGGAAAAVAGAEVQQRQLGGGAGAEPAEAVRLAVAEGAERQEAAAEVGALPREH